MFDITSYRKTKREVERRIKETLPKWKTTQGFVLDGLLSPELYAAQKIKVLFILGEYYDHEKDGMIDIETQSETDFWRTGQKGYKTAKAVPALLWYLYNHRAGKPLRQSDQKFFSAAPENTRILRECFNRCGVIDIKKESASMSGNRQTKERIMEAARFNKDILIRQIDSISPDIIIACSGDVREALWKEKILTFPGKIEQNKVIQDDRNRNVFFTKHPTRWSYDDLYAVYTALVPLINRTLKREP